MFEHYKHKKLKCLYLITLNGKKYVGQTKNTSVRFSKHRTIPGCDYIFNAIQTHGWENATIEILLVDLTLEEANRLETHYIDTLGTLAPGGYNLKRGGDSNEWCDEAREAQSDRMKIVCDTLEFREAKSELMKKLWEDPSFIEANIQRLEDLWSKEAREAQSEKMKIIWGDPEFKEAQGDRLKQRWEIPEFREAHARGQQERYEKEEEREKARKSHAHMRKFTDEELVEMNDEFKGSVGKLSAYFGVSQCVIGRHKTRLKLTGKRYNK